MKKGIDIPRKFPGLFLVHQNIPAKSLAPHSHEEHHLFIPLQGEISLDILGDEYILGPGKMLYIPPDVEHSFNSSKTKGERFICNISKELWVTQNGVPCEKKSLILPCSQMIKELISYLITTEREKVNCFIETLASSLGEIVSRADQSIKEVSSYYSKIQDERLKQAFKLMQEELNLSISSIAEKSGMSVRTFGRLFSSELEISPRDLQTLFRIGKAKELLSSSTLSKLDIAEECGYMSYSQFINQFKKVTGILPSDWK